MFGNLFNVEDLVKKYLLKLLTKYAEKKGVDPDNVAIMLQTDPRTKNKTLLFTGWDVENINSWKQKEWISNDEIIKTLKD